MSIPLLARFSRQPVFVFIPACSTAIVQFTQFAVRCQLSIPARFHPNSTICRHNAVHPVPAVSNRLFMSGNRAETDSVSDNTPRRAEKGGVDFKDVHTEQ